MRSRSRCCSDAMYCRPAVAERAELVQLGVVAVADDAAVGQRGRRPILEARRSARRARSASRSSSSTASASSAARRPSGRANPASALSASATSGSRRNESRSAPSSRGVARPGRGPAGQTLEIAHAVERLAQPGATAAVAHRHLHRVEPGVDRRRIAERREQPLAQQPPAHRRDGGVDGLEQGAAPGAGAERLDQLEVPAGHLVEPEEGVAPADRRAGEVGQPGRLELGEVAEQRAAAPRAAASSGPTPRPSSEARAKRRASSSRARSGSNSQRLAHGEAGHAAAGSGGGVVGGHHDLGGAEADERLGESRLASSVSSRNSPVLRSIAASPTSPPRSPLPRCRADRAIQLFRAAGEPAFLEQRAGRHRLDHFAPHQPLGELGDPPPARRWRPGVRRATSCRR